MVLRLWWQGTFSEKHHSHYQNYHHTNQNTCPHESQYLPPTQVLYANHISNSIAIPLSSSISPSPIFPRMLLKIQLIQLKTMSWRIEAKTRALKRCIATCVRVGGIECSCVCGTESVFFLALLLIFILIYVYSIIRELCFKTPSDCIDNFFSIKKVFKSLCIYIAFAFICIYKCKSLCIYIA